MEESQTTESVGNLQLGRKFMLPSIMRGHQGKEWLEIRGGPGGVGEDHGTRLLNLDSNRLWGRNASSASIRRLGRG